MRSPVLKILDRLTRVTTSTTFLPEIDGLRFLAIIWVVLFHLQSSFLTKTAVVAAENDVVFRMFFDGDQGVLLFFMISGFILCLPFARHFELGEKKVALAGYYVRRVIRIEPPYIIACIVIFVLLVVRAKYTFAELLPHLGASLIYQHTLLYHETSLINVVFWSLEVEVQFYILAPLLTWIYFSFSAIVRRVSVAVLLMLLPLLQSQWLDAPLSVLLYIQYFLAGFFVCDLYVNRRDGFFSANTFAAVTLLALMLVINQHESLLQRTILPIVMGLFFLFVLFNPSCKRFFSIKLITVIGGMCYSIYLIHFQIIAALGDYSMRYLVGHTFYLNLLIQILLIVPMLLVISAVFFLSIEKPFMKVRWTPYRRKNNSDR